MLNITTMQYAVEPKGNGLVFIRETPDGTTAMTFGTRSSRSAGEILTGLAEWILVSPLGTLDVRFGDRTFRLAVINEKVAEDIHSRAAFPTLHEFVDRPMPTLDPEAYRLAFNSSAWLRHDGSPAWVSFTSLNRVKAPRVASATRGSVRFLQAVVEIYNAQKVANQELVQQPFFISSPHTFAPV